MAAESDEIYQPEAPITMKESTSLYPNNLSIWSGNGATHYIVASKGLVNLVIAKSGGTMQRNLEGKMCSHARPVIQAKYVTLSGTLYLVMCTFQGIQIHTALDQRQLLFHPLNPDPAKPGEEVFAQGVCGVFNDMIAVGLSSGRIIIFKKDSGAFIKFDTLQASFPGHSNPICDLKQSQKKLFTSDDNGCILVWHHKGDSWELVKTFEGAGSPCSTLCVYKEFVIGGFGSGHIRIFDHSEGSLVAEITAHARWINAIDVTPSGLITDLACWVFYKFTNPNTDWHHFPTAEEKLPEDDIGIRGHDRSPMGSKHGLRMKTLLLVVLVAILKSAKSYTGFVTARNNLRPNGFWGYQNGVADCNFANSGWSEWYPRTCSSCSQTRFMYCKGVRIGCGEWYCLGSKVETCGARCPVLQPLDPRVRVSDTRTECGTQVDFSCPKCFQALPEDSTTAECLFNGTWTAQPPRCSHVTCKAPDTPQNGYATWGSNCHDRATFKCYMGYELIGDSEQLCNEQGEWTPKVSPICVPIKCPLLVSPDNGFLFQLSRVYRARAYFRCKIGYELHGTRSIRCSARGSWSPGPPTCIRSQMTDG
eukprot:sb/3463285/